MDIVGSVPNEMSEMILSYLSPNDLLNCSHVSRRWRCLVNRERLWSIVLPFASYFPLASDFADCGREGMKLCPTMRKYIGDRLAMKRYKEEKEMWSSFGNRESSLVRPDLVSIPSPRRFGRDLTVGLDYPLCVNPFLSLVYCSEDGQFVACLHYNIVYIYSRPSSAGVARFRLKEILAFKQRSVNLAVDDSECFVWKKRRGDDNALARDFVERYQEHERVASSCLFSGTGTERIFCLQSFNFVIIWNITNSRVAAHLKFDLENSVMKVEAGWEGSGLCVSLTDTILCYDFQGQLTHTFHIPEEQHILLDTLLMRSFSVVFAGMYYFDEDERPKVKLLEFRREDPTPRTGFDVDIINTANIRLKGGPVYPVALISQDQYTPTRLYIGLLNTDGVCTWHPSTINFNILNGKIFQFVDRTSYLLLSSNSLYKHLLYKVSLRRDERRERNDEQPELVLVSSALWQL